MFQEGAVALPDGSVLVVEIAGGRLSRVTPDGAVSVIANLGGGPNGAAIGPDGKCYICNNVGRAGVENRLHHARHDRSSGGDGLATARIGAQLSQ
jgi:gluconolactonase